MPEVEESPILGSDGKPIKHVTIPIVKYLNSDDEEFIFPMHMVEEEELIQEHKEGVRPSEIIRELRAVTREMRHRFTILAAGLAVAAKKGPDELDVFLNSVGLVISDARGKDLFKPKESVHSANAEINKPAMAEKPSG